MRLGIWSAMTSATCVLALTGCGGGGASTPHASTPTTAALGDAVMFHRADGGDLVGTIRFTEAAEVPASCLYDPIPAGAQALAVRAEVENPGVLFLPKPDIYGLAVVDHGGFTQKVDSLSIKSECESQFPEIGPSQSSGKTSGWEVFQVQEANPAMLVYSPIVAEPDSTIDNIKFVQVSPASAKIQLPALAPVAAPSTAAPTTEELPAVIETTPPPPARPAAGKVCDPDADGWATDSDGDQLRCAYAGGPTPKWVNSVPFIGTRKIGASCELGAAVAETSKGETLVCVGEAGSSTWMVGP